MTPPSQRGERAKRVKLWECCACGHIDTEGHACPKLNGLTSANGLGEFLPLSAVQALAERVAEQQTVETSYAMDEATDEEMFSATAAVYSAARRLRDLTNPDKEET